MHCFLWFENSKCPFSSLFQVQGQTSVSRFWELHVLNFVLPLLPLLYLNIWFVWFQNLIKCAMEQAHERTRARKILKTLLNFFSASSIQHKTSKIIKKIYLCYDYKYVHHDIFSFITYFLVNKSSAWHSYCSNKHLEMSLIVSPGNLEMDTWPRHKLTCKNKK